MGKKSKWGKFTKVFKYGNPTDIQSWNRMQHDEARRKELGLAADAANARNSAGEQAAARAQELRDRQKRLYRPMEEGLAAEYMAGYNPDYAQITTQAQEDVGGAFDRGAGAYNRNAARLGVDQNVSGDPEVQRLRDLDETAAKVFAGNTAVNTARDRSENLTATRGAQLIALGQQRPYLASQESLAGNAALADILDYQTMGRAQRGADRRAGDVQGGQAVASFFVHGGSVKKPMRYGINRPVINSTAKRVYADGGEVTRPRREMGGAVGETARLSNMHREEYGAGKTDKQFGEWLDENGYELGGDNMARPKASIRTSSNQNVDDRPRTPDFLFKPLKKAPKHYAEGGLIEDVPVDLETNDYIMPADVVSTLGREYFDDLIAGTDEEEPEPHYASGGLVGGIRPGQGLANFASGFRDGQMDYRRIKAFDEDREYQNKQRAREDQSYETQKGIRAAVSQFVASDGLDASPLIDFYNRSNQGSAKLDLSKKEDGTFALNVMKPDGTTESKVMKPEEVREFGMKMTQALIKPESYFDKWNDKPTTVNTPYGGVTHAYDPRTRKWSSIADNNSDAKAAQGAGRGGRGADVLGWKDHNQMNDDIQRLAFRRFSVPSPNGVGSILDPDGQQKAGMFKNFVFAELDKLGKSPRDLTSSELNAAAGLAETAVDEQFRRRGAKGIRGAGKGILNLFDADKAAADMTTYFPRGGSEPEMRAFMAQRDITDKADQDQVLSKMQTYQGGPRGGLGAGPAAKPTPVQKPGQRTAVDVKAEYKSGRISREQAVQELKAMGFQ